MKDRELEEIKTRWYKDPSPLVSSKKIAHQAYVDIQSLISTIEGLKGEVERYGKGALADKLLIQVYEDDLKSLSQQVEILKVKLNNALERNAEFALRMLFEDDEQTSQI